MNQPSAEVWPSTLWNNPVLTKFRESLARWNFAPSKLLFQKWGVTLISVVAAGSAGWLIAQHGEERALVTTPPTATIATAPMAPPEQPMISGSEVATIAHRVAKGFVSTLNESGTAGLRISVENCYERAGELKTAKSAVYCVMLDSLLAMRDAYVSQRLGFEQESFTRIEAVKARMVAALRGASFPTDQLPNHIEKWISTATRDTAAYACREFEVRWGSEQAALAELGCKSTLDLNTVQTVLDAYLDRSLAETVERVAAAKESSADSGEGDGSTSVAMTQYEQDCLSYGFRRGTSDFSSCQMRLDQARQFLEMEKQRYQLQLRLYEQQVAAFNAQQMAIKRERERKQGEALMRFGLGMASSDSPTFAGGMQDGLAAMSGLPIRRPIEPDPPPTIQNYTVRMPNGLQVRCSHLNSYINCR